MNADTKAQTASSAAGEEGSCCCSGQRGADEDVRPSRAPATSTETPRSETARESAQGKSKSCCCG